MIRCDSRADFNTCTFYGYSAAGEPFGACPCYGYSTTAGSPLRHCLHLLCIHTRDAEDYLTILPLILLLPLNPLHADHLLQLRESKTAERLGEDVRELLTSFDELDDDLSFIDTAPEEVELPVDVLAPVVENQILREGEGGSSSSLSKLIGNSRTSSPSRSAVFDSRS